MPIMTDDQRKTLATRLAEPDCAKLDEQAAADLLNATPIVDNPARRGQVPRPFAVSEVMALLDPATIGGFKVVAYLPAVVAALSSNDRPAITLWAFQLQCAGLLTQEQHDAILGLIARTDDDPAWPAQVPGQTWARANFQGVEFVQPDGTSETNEVTAAMVKEARG